MDAGGTRGSDAVGARPAGAVEITEIVPGRDPLAAMAAEVREGLLASPRWLPSKYFYDERGSDLFDEITRLPEYYPSRTEANILEERTREIVEAVRPQEMFEIGPGSGQKTRRWVAAGRAAGTLSALTLLDVHRVGLEATLSGLAREFPGLLLRGFVGDFARDLAGVPPRASRLALFLGGTIGNLHPDREVPRFLADVAGCLGAGGAFLVGLDLEKDVAELEAAYDDPGGVTADFNRNVLRVVNARLDGDFEPERFEHVAFYDRSRRWIEMRLRATSASRVRIGGSGLDLSFRAGDEIRTEISCKYTRASFETRLAGTGLGLDGWFTDARDRFALALLRPAGVEVC